MIVRDPAKAAATHFDLVIIGGGIYGVSLLQQAARRNLCACLCEADDFGAGTSWNTLRILHGGVRHLQSLSLDRFFQSIRARRRMALQFPRLVRPLSCLMPLYGQGLKRSSVMRLGLLAGDLFDLWRNVGLPAAARLPAGRVLDAAKTRSQFPLVRAQGLQGAACWSDYFMISSERILMELLRDACRHGATALNYSPVLEIVTERRSVCGVRIRDRMSGQGYTITAPRIVNCAGPRLQEFARGRGGDAERLFPPSLAFNLLLDLQLPGPHALAVSAPEPDAPVLFLVPQGKTTLAGTLHLPRPADTIEARPTGSEIDRFLELLNAAVPGLGTTPDRVRRVYAGLLPATAPGGTELARRELLADHGALGGPQGLYSVSGVKFTTAGDVARRTLALLGVKGGAGAATELALSAATAVLTDGGALAGMDDASLGALLQAVVHEESVQCVDDLVLRRANWCVTGTEVDSTRFSRLLGLPFCVPSRN